MIYKDIAKQIDQLRNELHFEIEQSGIDARKTLEVSEKLDELIKEYYIKKSLNIENNIMYIEYKIAYNKIKRISKKLGYFPTVNEWNKIAKEDTYLNNKSIEYIGRT